jgi:hypothetical protein
MSASAYRYFDHDVSPQFPSHRQRRKKRCGWGRCKVWHLIWLWLSKRDAIRWFSAAILIQIAKNRVCGNTSEHGYEHWHIYSVPIFENQI